MNNILFGAELLLAFAGLFFAERLFKEKGLIAWSVFAVIFANIQTIVSADVLFMQACLGNVLFGTVFTATDIMTEKYGKKMAYRLIYICAGILGFSAVFSWLTIHYSPNELDMNMPFVKGVLTNGFRAFIGSLTAFLIGNVYDIFIYDKMRRKTKGRLMWLRNNVATMTAQLLDNVVLFSILFAGQMSFKDILVISCSTWVLEFVVALVDTPFLYLTVISRLLEHKGNDTLKTGE